MSLEWKEAQDLQELSFGPVSSGLERPTATGASYLAVDFDALLAAVTSLGELRGETKLEAFSSNMSDALTAVSRSASRRDVAEDAASGTSGRSSETATDDGVRAVIDDFVKDTSPTICNAVDRKTVDGRRSAGIVDFSIAFLNRRFRRAGGTKSRIEMIWLQDRDMCPPAGVAPPRYAKLLGFGTLLLRADIDALIARHTHGGWLDEEAAYAEFSRPPRGLRDAWAQRVGHGTAILDHMAGAEPGEIDETRPIYAAELPTSALADTSGQRIIAPLFLGLTAIGALSYLLPLSQGETPDDTLVINASLAFTGGPEDGGNLHAKNLEHLMNAVDALSARDVVLTVPTGNHLQDRIYARADAKGQGVLDWLIPEGDRTPSTVEVFSESGFEEAELSIATPLTGFLDVGDLPDRGKYRDLVQDGEVLLRLSRPAAPWPDHLLITVRATDDPAGGRAVALAGPWRIKFRTQGEAWRFWIRRDETLSGFRRAGRQSRFRDFGYKRFDDDGDLAITDNETVARPIFVSREGTGSVLAVASTKGGTIRAVAGTQNSTVLKPGPCGEPYRFGGRRKDVEDVENAEAERSRALGGRRAAGRFGRSKVRLAGTSIASAIFARDLLEGRVK